MPVLQRYSPGQPRVVLGWGGRSRTSVAKASLPFLHPALARPRAAVVGQGLPWAMSLG